MAPATPTPARRRGLPGAALLAFRRDPLGFLSGLAADQGDVATFRIGSTEGVLLSNPDDIRDVLVTQSRSFGNGIGRERMKPLLGDGLLTSDGEFHLRQRRLAAPAFHRQRIAAYGATMAALAEQHHAAWCDGQEVDFAQEMMRLTLRIAGQTLFAADTTAATDEVSAAVHELMGMFSFATPGFLRALEVLPLPHVRRFNAARARLDRIIYQLIAERRAAGDDRGDLLSMLIAARDAEGDGSGMSDVQLRDEALTIFLAGHETTANALSWTFYLLSQNPHIAERLHAELDAALAGRAPTPADLPRLRYTEQVLAESMRLYPPAWTVGRRSREPFTVSGGSFPAGTWVIMSQWVVHHDPRHYPDPYRFDPGRFAPEVRAARPKFAYFPFGGGPRLCIGEQFAWMEGTLLLASIARRWRPALRPGHPVVLQPSVTLRPRHGLRMRLLARPGVV